MFISYILSKVNQNYEHYIKNSTTRSLENTIRDGDTGGYFGNMSKTDYKYLITFSDDLPMFHDLPFRVHIHLPTMLTRLGRVQVTYDHYFFWTWTAEVLKIINRNEEYFRKDIERMFLLVVDYAVGTLGSAPVSQQIWEENKQIRQLVSPHAERAILRSHRAATQLSYPLLEGLLRRLCSDFVDLDGLIKDNKSILKLNGEEQKGGRANNVGDLLHHYEKRVAGREIASSLKSIRSDMSVYSKSGNGYYIVNSWRHPHSHGGERLSGPEHVVLLNIVCQLIWDVIPIQEYSSVNKEEYSQKILGEGIHQQLGSFDYYPLKYTKDFLTVRNWSP